MPSSSSSSNSGLTLSEHETIVSSIESETAKAHAKVLESEGLLVNNTNILRIEPIFRGSNGHGYWKLNATGKSEVFCQNIGKGDDLSTENKWSILDIEEKEAIEKHLSSLRGKKAKGPRVKNMKSRNLSRGNEPDAGGLT